MKKRILDFLEDTVIYFAQEVVIGIAEAVGCLFWLVAMVFWALHLAWLAVWNLDPPDYDLGKPKSPLPPPPSAN